MIRGNLEHWGRENHLSRKIGAEHRNARCASRERLVTGVKLHWADSMVTGKFQLDEEHKPRRIQSETFGSAGIGGDLVECYLKVGKGPKDVVWAYARGGGDCKEIKLCRMNKIEGSETTLQRKQREFSPVASRIGPESNGRRLRACGGRSLGLDVALRRIKENVRRSCAPGNPKSRVGLKRTKGLQRHGRRWPRYASYRDTEGLDELFRRLLCPGYHRELTGK
ncbi:hypothetical protein DFH07DRAFT_777182 [Mycena maculata]|uniref:Uncharacterized protein n=1 Tax=Mycena maculata TaxID=230809 RepID=A0AAD7IIM2_9AGAR|nr:hypothetical protein DFH07DRAFT_777182 [Mycena maculata]